MHAGLIFSDLNNNNVDSLNADSLNARGHLSKVANGHCHHPDCLHANLGVLNITAVSAKPLADCKPPAATSLKTVLPFQRQTKLSFLILQTGHSGTDWSA